MTKPALNSAASPKKSLMRRALSLGGANAFDYAMQFLLPVLLVRQLSPEAFGGYRMLWLAVTTIMTISVMSMPQSLYYFLPRGDSTAKRAHVHVTILYLVVTGLIGALLIGPWNPLLPRGMDVLAPYGWMVPAVMLLFSITALLDILPTIDERVGAQVIITISLSLLRTVALGMTAFYVGDLKSLIYVLVMLLLLKMLFLAQYVGRTHGLRGRWFHWRTFVTQFKHAAPLGMSSTLYGLRGQGDQWVAAAIFSIGNFAAFSIAAVFGPLVNLFRQSVNHVFMPTMSRLQASGDLKGMVELNSQANATVATLVFPLLALAFTFAEEIITLVYTGTYVNAAAVMRVYVVGLVAFVIELAGLMLLLRDGVFAARLQASLLFMSLAVSAFAAYQFGLAGAALGSTLTIFIDRFATLQRISVLTCIPLGKLQDWPNLIRVFVESVLAALIARTAVHLLLEDSAGFVRLAAGASVMAAIAGALWLRRRVSA